MSLDETTVCMSGRCKYTGDVIIHVDCASHMYPDGTPGIHDMCFSVCRREIVVLCGANGSGKSTLLEHLNGLMTASSGAVYVIGKLCREIKETVWKHVSLVFQRPEDQQFAPTVLDDVMFGPVNPGMAGEQARAAAREALEMVGAAGLADKIPNYLSGCEKRLVAIAGVLVMKPDVICMDEPTADLDDFHWLRIEELMLRLRNARGVSLVIATHDAGMAARLADRVCIVKGGSIIAEGPPGDIFYDCDTLPRAGLTPPAVVDIYLKYCDRKGIVPAERPVTMSQLLNIIAR